MNKVARCTTLQRYAAASSGNTDDWRSAASRNFGNTSIPILEIRDTNIS